MPTTREYDNLKFWICSNLTLSRSTVICLKVGKVKHYILFTLKWSKTNRNPTGLLRIISWSLLITLITHRKTQTELFWTICVQIERKRIRLKRVPSSSVSFLLSLSPSLPPSLSMLLPPSLSLSSFLPPSLSLSSSSPRSHSLSLPLPLP